MNGVLRGFHCSAHSHCQLDVSEETRNARGSVRGCFQDTEPYDHSWGVPMDSAGKVLGKMVRDHGLCKANKTPQVTLAGEGFKPAAWPI